MANTKRGTRAQSAADTRARVVDAARGLFVEHGYRSTSLREIAAAAGLTHPGLQRHFATKDELLVSVMAELEAANASFYAERAAAADPGALLFSELARRNAATPGYLELFAALSGEASTPTHPAHQHMRDRYARLDEIAAETLSDAIDHGVIAEDRDPLAEAIRLSAGWDGIQLLSQYLPGRVDVVALLEAREELLAYPAGWRDPDDARPQADAEPIAPPTTRVAADPPGGYAAGRERRERIIADATELFAREGYGDTSLQDVARTVGVAKSTLLHHYPTKEALLRAVLVSRDRALASRAVHRPSTRAADELRARTVDAAGDNAAAAGLIEVYAVLSSEAVPETHPAHQYFTERFAHIIGQFAELFRVAQADGELPSHRDPEQEAIWLVALWDGLQYRWLYDRDAVDVAEHLAAHLADVLPR